MSWLRGAFLALLTGAFVAFGLGFFAFTDAVSRAAPSPAPDGDGIVALTGGSQRRLSTGVRLLQEGRGRRLLISGVNRSVTDAQLFALLHISPETAACCVDIGRSAEDTLGNASEAAAWANRNGFRRIILVTDDYHMPRSYVELSLALPQAEVLAYPVATRLAARGRWRRDFSAASKLGAEYVKYLMIRTRALFIHGPQAPADAVKTAPHT